MLTFIDLAQGEHVVQGLCDFSRLRNQVGGLDEFKRSTRALRRGDILSEIGSFKACGTYFSQLRRYHRHTA